MITETASNTTLKNPYQGLFDNQMDYFLENAQHSTASERIKWLKKMRKWVWNNKEAIREALHKDFKKATVEVDLTETKATLAEIDHALMHLREWMRTQPVETPLRLLGIRSKVYHEPKGPSLIISPWNFPFMLAAVPMASAIAAGCTVVLKPSEVTHHTAQLLERMAKEVFPPEYVTVIQGGVPETTDLLKLKWGHIFFTGSPGVGKIIMRAAAENLSSVTLELGGRNPVIVDETADLNHTASKLIWGKFFNCGQSCMSPNYIYVHKSKHKGLLEALKKHFQKQYGDPVKIKDNPDFARIVDDSNFQRVKKLLDGTLEAGATVVIGGQTDESDRFIAPTILDNVPLDSPVMEQEIFGPVLPIVPYNDLDEAIKLFQRDEKPLALNIFSKSRKNIKKVLERTSAGSTAINETTLQFGNPYLPFGGISSSGLGRSHGYHGFLDFTNERAILHSRSGFTLPKLILPPYSGKIKQFLVDFTMRWL